MAEMYAIVRSHSPAGLIVIGGQQQYAQYAAGSIALVQQYMRENNGSKPTNVIWNLHVSSIKQRYCAKLRSL